MTFERQEVREVITWAWSEIPNHFPSVKVGAFVVMPNHVHGIVIIEDSVSSTDPAAVGARHASPLRPLRRDGVAKGSLGAVVGSFKAAVTRELRLRDLWQQRPLWQNNYYDRVIRDENELDRIREYIAYNPTAWLYDHENPDRSAGEDHERQWGWLENVDFD